MPNYSIQQKALNQLLTGLQNLGCSYVIIDKDGADYTYGDAFKKGRKKKSFKYPYGSIRDHYYPWIKDLAPGDAVEIPAKDFAIEDIQAGVSAKAANIWGPGTFVTSMNRDNSTVEVLRVL
jgi:hypothetical protein